MVYKVKSTVARSLRAKDGTAPFQPLAGERGAVELRGKLLVHAEEVANLATAHSDVAGRHVEVGTDDLIQLHHKGLAETHDFSLALASRSKVGAALAATHW